MVYGGHGTYGFALGILTLDSKFARIPGDVGNATTYQFPVLYKIIQGASGPRVLQGDRTLLEPFFTGGSGIGSCRLPCNYHQLRFSGAFSTRAGRIGQYSGVFLQFDAGRYGMADVAARSKGGHSNGR